MNRKPEFHFDRSLYHSTADVQIRFNDIDILGHLNNVVYFSLFDTAKAQYLHHGEGHHAEFPTTASL